MKKHVMSRRSFLRGSLAGASLSLALPPLEAMINSKGAWADGSIDDPFFGVFFWANGLPWHDAHGVEQAGNPDEWTPAGATASSVLLQPLVRHQVSVLSGLEPKTIVPTSPGGQSDGHMRGFMVALTGDRPRPEDFDHGSHTLTALRQSVDQYVADHPEFYSSRPQFRSLELGVSEARFHDYGHWNAISYNGPNSLNLPIMRPTLLHDHLFSAPTSIVEATRRSRMLDAVLADAQSLKMRLGVKDQQRLAAHLEHIHAIQNRLENSTQACIAPARPSDQGSLHERTQTMAELLAIAIDCGLTRVFSFMLTSPATTHVFSNLSVPDGMHKTCHDGHLARVRAITEHQIEAFAIFLDAFANLSSPTGGSLLDRGLIFGTSEYGEGWKHSVKELPVVLAGGANGRLQRGVHARQAQGNLSKAHLTMLTALGLSDEQFGFNGGETTELFTEVLS
jgi:hypothetical protein